MNKDDFLNKALLGISNIINPIINYVILILFVIVLVWLLSTNKKLKQFRTEKLIALKGKTRTKISKSGYNMKQVQETVALRSDFFNLRNDYEQIVKDYDIISILIPLFPLFGILGTVSGLIAEIASNGSSEAIISSLNVALTSTLMGLIAAIILKLIESLGSQNEISQIENQLEDYSLKYEDNNQIVTDEATEE